MISSSNKYDLIIFDCDGTLVDSEMLIHQSCSAALREQGFAKFTPEYCASTFKGISMRDILILLQAELGSSFKAELFMRNASEKSDLLIAEHIRPINNAAQLLTYLDNTPKCVASNGEHERVVLSLESTNLKKFFADKDIFTYRMVGKAKPAPDLFLYAAEQMRFSAAKCLVIEDSLIGVRAARAANMDVIYIKSDAHSKEESAVLEYKPLAMIDDLLEVKKYLH
jgi:HAD superfamily hydrolase (TIGR01509 family)